MEERKYDVDYIAPHIVDEVDIDDYELLEQLVEQDAKRYLSEEVQAVRFDINTTREADSYEDVAGFLTVQGTPKGIEDFIGRVASIYGRVD